MHRQAATVEVIFENAGQRFRFMIGDVRDYAGLARAVMEADVAVGAAALKQVPSCEYFPREASRTSIEGAANLVRAIAPEFVSEPGAPRRQAPRRGGSRSVASSEAQQPASEVGRDHFSQAGRKAIAAREGY